MEAATVSSIVTNVGTFFTEALGWMGEVLEVITSNPLLTIMCVCVPIAGIGIGYANRLLRG